MEIGLLGPVEVADAGGSVPVPGVRARRLLAALALAAPEAVPADRLIDLVWGEELPVNAANALQVQVSKLRRLLGEGCVVTRGGGYGLDPAHVEVDVRRFEGLLAEGRAALAAGEDGRAAEVLARALALWRGAVAVELDDAVLSEQARLDELRLAALELRVEADLRLGAHEPLVAELEALTAAHPLRERFWAQRMLYQTSRPPATLSDTPVTLSARARYTAA